LTEDNNFGTINQSVDSKTCVHFSLALNGNKGNLTVGRNYYMLCWL
jgi:hypothetical protein